MKKIKIIKYIMFTLYIMFSSVYSQKNQTSNKYSSQSNFIYYIDLKGVNTKDKCLLIEQEISKKEGVDSFRTVGFPSKYFILKATKEINQSLLKGWLINYNIELIYFGVGENSLEQLYINKRNQNKN